MSDFPVAATCGKCHKQTTKTLAWLETDGLFDCPHCGATSRVRTDPESLAALKQRAQRQSNFHDEMMRMGATVRVERSDDEA